MPKITDLQREARRQAFLDAALECLQARSFRDITVDDICSQANASKGAFYLYFPSKQELLFALLEDRNTSFQRTLAKLSQPGLSGHERLRRFARAQLSEAQHPAGAQLLADLWGMATTDTRAREILKRSATNRRDTLRGWIEQAISEGDVPTEPRLANALASSLLALADGLVLHQSLDPKAFQWKNVQALLDAAVPEAALPLAAENGDGGV